jgi:glycosyltransferase involved in cell wall biosynthesis
MGMSVTVMIPAYNAEIFIRKAIDSVLNQTRPADEIVVVDDGSTDTTRTIVESYGRHVRLMVQKNQGPSVARNWSMQTIQSDFVAFIDADDLMEPTKLEKQLRAFVRNSRIPRLKELHYHLRFHNPGITPSCMMVRRSAYLEAGGFNTSLRGIDDWEFMARLFKVGPFCMVNEPLTRYRLSDHSLSSNAERIFQEVQLILDSFLLEGLSGMSRWVWRHRILSYQAFKAALTLRACRQNSAELRFILSSFAIWPSPFWYPVRIKALAVTLKNLALRST